MNENGGKGLFYGVIGVATLIVAIIGATFAWFTATDGQGAAETIVTTGTLTINYTDGSKIIATNLKPATAAQVGAAYANNTCAHVGETDFTYPENVDKETICSVYQFTVTNTGSLYADLTATLSDFAIAAAADRPAGLETAVTTAGEQTNKYFKYALAANAPGTAAATFTGQSLADATGITLSPSRLAPGAATTAYVVVWLDSAAGNSYQGITASARVTVNAAQTNYVAG